MSKFIIILLIVVLIFPGFAFSQKFPENFENLKGIGKGLWDRFIQGLKEAWEEAVKIWKKVIGWIGNIWNSYIFPFFKFIWQKIWNFCLKIIDQFLKNLWERIKGMIK